MTARLAVGFLPLVDAAPLIVSRELGFDHEEGLELELVRATSWSAIRDMLVFGRVDAAHMLAPAPIAMALGIGAVTTPVSALMVLSINGNVVGVSDALAADLRAAGHDFDFRDAAKAGRALVAAARDTLRIGVPFPFSMHAELLYYWLSASGLHAPQGIEIRTVPPPLMADALAAGEIDAFCVGEPWGSKVVEAGVGSLLLPGRAIWSFAPEKVLAVRSAWAGDEPEMAARLIRAVWKANRWLGHGGVHTTAAELLARSQYLDLSAEVIDRALTGQFVISHNGDTKSAPAYLEFFNSAATFPWKSQAAWIASQMAGRLGLDRAVALDQARAVFRSDLYRSALRDSGAILPGASEKLEGGITEGTAAASETGRLILSENQFFDGLVFDPAAQIR